MSAAPSAPTPDMARRAAAGPARLLIANRGEVALRILRAAAGLGIETAAIHAPDDAEALHVRLADRAAALPGHGAAAYLDIAAVIEAGRAMGCDAVHPGYGFLSENPDFARACAEAGLAFVGPSAEALALLGDKARARALAQELGVPVIPGSGETDLAGAAAFLDSLGPGGAVMVKAVAGGGGRGMRPVTDPAALPAAFAACAAEAERAFGDGRLYVERLLTRARHIEAQVIGDGTGDAAHLGERECSLQRRRQKLVEIAPSPSITPAQRAEILGHALAMARAARYRGLGTFEFLVDETDGAAFFIEANPRLQVEHTVTEAVTGVDLVEAQIRVTAGGARLADLGLAEAPPAPVGYAVQARVNLEVMQPDGTARPASGRLTAYEPPSGPGVRVDGAGYGGYAPSPHYDSLVAKVIVQGRGDYASVAERAYRALGQFRLEGAPSNLPFLMNLLRMEAVRANAVDIGFVDAHAAALAAPGEGHKVLFAGAGAAAEDGPALDGPAGTRPVTSPLTGVVAELPVAPGDAVHEGAPVAVLEAMKMQHVVTAPFSGILRAAPGIGDRVDEGAPLAFLEPAEIEGAGPQAAAEIDLDHIRPDLAESLARHRQGLDEGRPAAVGKRHAKGKRTARENVADLCDPGSFVEYGALAVAAQRSRHPEELLREISPADGLVAGVGAVNGALFGAEQARCAVMAYDYTVMAGTQGNIGHRKTDRLLKVAERTKLPVVVYAEGGGGRPGDTDNRPGVNLANPTFWQFARMSAVAPLVGVVSGRCFAGNAAVAGCCDVVIATEDASLGMGGPAMIEAAGLGAVSPEAVGPISVQSPNGVVDLVVADEAEATAQAKRYLAYFQGDLAGWEAPEPRRLRHVIPENRLRAYDVRAVIEGLADVGSVMELRRDFGRQLVTAFIRIEGKAWGVIANVPALGGGAVDAEEADKAARFLQLCDAFHVPILSLIDTPGFMVGPQSETRATVRRFSRMFLVGASLQTPMFSVILRKAYGLGAMAMAGGSFHESSQMTLSWPTGEFGAMGLEGAARLGFRKELEAIPDPEARQARYAEIVAGMYEVGKAVNIAPYLSVDDVIDPADTRARLAAALRAMPRATLPKDARRPMIDAW